MATDPGAPPNDPAEKARTRLSRLLAAASAVAALGTLVAASISYVHARTAAVGQSYTSFCNLGDTLNCDTVLRSPFSELWGVPLAWLALASYAAMTLLFARAARSAGARARGPFRLAAAAVAFAVVFSAYMAFVSLSVLGAVCIQCSALYLVCLVLAGLVLQARRLFAQAWPTVPSVLNGSDLLACLAVSVAAVSVLAAATWPSPTRMPPSLVSLADIRESRPDFYKWYMDLPVDLSAAATSGSRPGLGPKTAPVTIVEYSDLQCGHCRKNHVILKDLLERRPTDVRVIYRHFPLDQSCNEAIPSTIHPHACRAAEAAECAARQGRFMEMLDLLFDNQNQLFEAKLFKLAASLGLDDAAFGSCMKGRQTLSQIVADSEAGAGLHLTSTPTLFINGRKVRGAFEQATDYDYAVLIETKLAATDPGP